MSAVRGVAPQAVVPPPGTRPPAPGSGALAGDKRGLPSYGPVQAGTARASLLAGLALLLAAAASTLVASLPWLRAYQVGGAPLLLVLAAVLPVLVTAGVWTALRLSALVGLAASLTSLLALLLAFNGFSLGAVWDGLYRVPPDLLTETLPLSGGASLLVAPVVLTWLCSALCAELLARPARPSAAALGLPIAYFAIAYGATTSAPSGKTLAEAAVELCLVAVMAAGRQGALDTNQETAQAGPGLGEGEGRGLRSGTLRRSVSAVGLAGLLAGALGLALSGIPALATKPAALDRPNRLLSGVVVDPVDSLAALRDTRPAAPPVSMFLVTVDQPWDGYIAVADLDSYNGSSWSFSDTFKPTGGRVPVPPGPALPGTQLVYQHYDVQRPIGTPFLPAVGRPLQVSGASVDADTSTGMLASTAGAPLSYSVTSRAPSGSGLDLPASTSIAPLADVGGGSIADLTALPPGSVPDVADAVRFAVNLTGQAASPSFAFLQDLAASLKADERRVTAPKRSRSVALPADLAGTSLAQVINAVTVDRAATPEQFATFMAMVARYLGVPARVSTGFRVPAAATTLGPLAPGTYRLTNRDAWTWAELPLEGYGWVALDPTPLRTTIDPSAPPEQVKAAPAPNPRQATALPGNGAAHALAKRVKVGTGSGVKVNWELWLGAGVPVGLLVVLALATLAVPAGRRRVRRLRRRQGPGADLVTAGAWLELIDTVDRLGLRLAPSASGTEVSRNVAAHFGESFGPPSALLASLSDQALFCTRSPIGPEGAILAWATQDKLASELRRTAGRRRRLQSLVRVGSAPSRPGVRR